MGEWDLKRDYRIEHIEDSPIDRSAAGQLWVREDVLGPEEAERRTREICMVGSTGESELCGLSTTYLDTSPKLRLEMWHIRAFVAPEHRAGNLAVQLLLRTRIFLNDRFRSGEDPRAPGAIIEIENESLKRAFPAALWQPSMFTYIGDNARGDHCRVHWFDGARLPPPPEPGPGPKPN